MSVPNFLGTRRHRRLKPLSGLAGFTLVEVLIAVAIASLVGVIFMALMKHWIWSGKYLSQEVAWTVLKNDIRITLNNAEACRETFAALPLNNVETTITLKNSGGVPLKTLGDIRSGLQLTKLSARSGVSTSRFFLVTLDIQATKMRGPGDPASGSPGRRIHNDKMYINVATDGTSVLGCSYSGTGSWDMVDFKLHAIRPDTALTGGAVLYRGTSLASTYPQNTTVAFNTMHVAGETRSFVFLENIHFVAKGNFVEMQCSAYLAALGTLQQASVVVTLRKGLIVLRQIHCGTIQAPYGSGATAVANLSGLGLMEPMIAGDTYNFGATLTASRPSAADVLDELRVSSNPVLVTVKQFLATQ